MDQRLKAFGAERQFHRNSQAAISKATSALASAATLPIGGLSSRKVTPVEPRGVLHAELGARSRWYTPSAHQKSASFLTFSNEAVGKGRERSTGRDPVRRKALQNNTNR